MVEVMWILLFVALLIAGLITLAGIVYEQAKKAIFEHHAIIVLNVIKEANLKITEKKEEKEQ